MALDYVCEYYDYILPYDEDIEYLKNLVSSCGGTVLELACGTGRSVIPLAQAGFDVVGLDIAPGMLDIAREKIRECPPEVAERIHLEVADMTCFDLGRAFSLVTIPHSSFTYLLKTEDQLRCLECVNAHLLMGGVFFMTVFNESPEALADKMRFTEFDITPEFVMPDGRRVMRRFKYVERDLANQVEVKDSIFYVKWPDGREVRLVHRYSMRYFFKYELIHLLARAGIEVTGIYSDYHKTPLDPSITEGMIIIEGRKVNTMLQTV